MRKSTLSHTTVFLLQVMCFAKLNKPPLSQKCLKKISPPGSLIEDLRYVNIDLCHIQYGISVAESQTFSILAKRPQQRRARRNGCFCRLQSWNKTVEKIVYLGGIFSKLRSRPILPSPLPLEAVLLGLQKKAGSLSICRKQL